MDWEMFIDGSCAVHLLSRKGSRTLGIPSHHHPFIVQLWRQMLGHLRSAIPSSGTCQRDLNWSVTDPQLYNNMVADKDTFRHHAIPWCAFSRRTFLRRSFSWRTVLWCAFPWCAFSRRTVPWVVNHWNTHVIRHNRLVNCPSGVPNEMYHTP